MQVEVAAEFRVARSWPEERGLVAAWRRGLGSSDDCGEHVWPHDEREEAGVEEKKSSPPCQRHRPHREWSSAKRRRRQRRKGEAAAELGTMRSGKRRWRARGLVVNKRDRARRWGRQRHREARGGAEPARGAGPWSGSTGEQGKSREDKGVGLAG